MSQLLATLPWHSHQSIVKFYLQQHYSTNGLMFVTKYNFYLMMVIHQLCMQEGGWVGGWVGILLPSLSIDRLYLQFQLQLVRHSTNGLLFDSRYAGIFLFDDSLKLVVEIGRYTFTKLCPPINFLLFQLLRRLSCLANLITE